MKNLDPHNVEAEQSVLGALLIDIDTILFVGGIIKPDDFYIERHAWVYDAILDLHQKNQPADLVTLADELDRRGKLNGIGGEAYLTELMNVTPTSLHAEYYAKIIKRASVLRQLTMAAGTVAEIAHKRDIDAEDALQRASDTILQVSTDNITSKPQPVKYYTSTVLSEIERQLCGDFSRLSTGLVSLDKRLGGLNSGKLYLVAGRPAMGKSSLGLQIAMVNAKLLQKRVLYFSREMPGEELTIRMISAEAGIDGERIQHGALKENEWPLFYEAINYIANWPIYIDDRTQTVEGIRARSILQAASGLDLVIVDYVQRIHTGNSYRSRDSEIGAVSDALKSMATDLGVPVVAISSLNRKCEERNNKRPMLADLRDSGNLEYDADVVMFIYRDEIYYPDTEYPNLAEISIVKNRGGKLGVITTYFKKHLTQFVDLETKKSPVY